MSHAINRRDLLKRGAAAAAGAAVLRGTSGLAQPAPAEKLTLFNYAEVHLLDGPMLDQFRHNHALFLNLNEDSLLKPFRQKAGMAAPGEDMGGWYTPSDKFDPPREMLGFIPGHSFGQYVSALARAYAATGDQPTREKVQRLVQRYAATITPKFYAGYCLPAYTFDKLSIGLIDAHQFAGDPQALAVMNHATDAALPWLPPKALNRSEMHARPHPNEAYTWDESYTLPENFYLAYQRGAGARHRLLAQRFVEDDTYFNPLAEGHNVLPGEHAYSHVNALSSAMQAYLTDGSAKHLRAAKTGFQFVLDQSFATGGWGPDESFRRPGSDEVASTLHASHNSFETPCGAYGHFKIARYLMRATGESWYGDSMEAVLYNTILGARPIQPDGTSFYYADYNMDAVKVDYGQKWPCCSGTFPQLTADYGISSYLRSPNGIAVNLFVPSRVTWNQGRTRITLTQTTRYPDLGETALHLSMTRPERFVLKLRVPAWAGKNTIVRVNGRAQPQPLQPGTWAEVDRLWRDGDRVEFSLDMPLRLVPLDPAHPNIVALVRGPVALFALNPAASNLTRAQLLAAQPVSRGSRDWQTHSDQGKVMLRPFPAIMTEHYRLYHEV